MIPFAVFVLAFFFALLALCLGVANGAVAKTMVHAEFVQPAAKDAIRRIGWLGMALLETVIMLALIVGVMLYFSYHDLFVEYAVLPALGMGCALGLSGITIIYSSAQCIRAACWAVARQPFFGTQILRFMLLLQVFLETPFIFAFMLCLFMTMQLGSASDFFSALRLLAVGLCFGIGSVGPIIGLGLASTQALEGVGFDRALHAPLLSYTILSQALIETPMIFTLLIAGILLFGVNAGTTMSYAVALLSAALAMGLCSCGVGLNLGILTKRGMRVLMRNQDQINDISRLILLGQVFIDTGAIYGLGIALVLIFLSS